MRPPTAAPLTSMSDLLAWRPGTRADDALCRANVPLLPRPGCQAGGFEGGGGGDGLRQSSPPRRLPTPALPLALPSQAGTCLPPGPRVLACHDLAGGYGVDAAAHGWRAASGSSVDGAAADPPPPHYAFTHWPWVDAFVYFAHSLVSPPPPGWVDAAHSHGVPVRGGGAAGKDWAARAAAPAAAHAPSYPTPYHFCSVLAHSFWSTAPGAKRWPLSCAARHQRRQRRTPWPVWRPGLGLTVGW